MNGVVIIDKAPGWTSTRVVAVIKKVYPHRKVGHIGTLDPLATGVLPVCIGEATKIADYLVETFKEYRCTALLGYTSPTLDTESELTTGGAIADVDEAAISNILQGMTGDWEQQVPVYSAVKVNGMPLYKMARKGIGVIAPIKRVIIQRITMEKFYPPRVDLLVRCSKGTYIRSLCAYIGSALGCGAVMESLCRTRSGSFNLDMALRLPLDGDKNSIRAILDSRIIPLKQIISEMPHFVVRSPEKIRNGCQPTRDVIGAPATVLTAGETVGFIEADSVPLAIGRMLYGSAEMQYLEANIPVAKILRVFNRT